MHIVRSYQWRNSPIQEEEPRALQRRLHCTLYSRCYVTEATKCECTWARLFHTDNQQQSRDAVEDGL